MFAYVVQWVESFAIVLDVSGSSLNMEPTLYYAVDY